MHTTHRIFVTPEVKMSDLIINNPSILILLEHFDTNCLVRNDNVREFCLRHEISEKVFTLFANLYNGYTPQDLPELHEKDILTIIHFLAHSHNYYKTQKYPEIQDHISQLGVYNSSPEISLIQTFFHEYFNEVIEHLEYENTIVFPFFKSILKDKKDIHVSFSALEYKHNHTDIEYKLDELKELLLKHVPIHHDKVLRRMILISLFELEHDLHLHSVIEETILTPLMHSIEKQYPTNE